MSALDSWHGDDGAEDGESGKDAAMGAVIELSDYRKKGPVPPRDGLRMEMEGLFMVIKHFRNGVFVGKERVLSEHMLREMLEHAR